MKKFLRNLLLVVLAFGMFTLAACNTNNGEQPGNGENNGTENGGNENGGNENGGNENENKKTPVAEFTGSTTIDEVVYNVVLALYEDKTLELQIADSIDPVAGTYVFVEGKGYELTIGNASLVTKWNAETSSHVFDYELKLGDLGKGTVTLSLVDNNFVLTAKAPKVEFIEGATFDGVLNAFGSHNLHLRFNEDGTYNITTDTEMAMVKGMLEKSGAYTYANNVFTINYDGTEYSSVFNPYTNSYALTYLIKGQDGNFEVTLTYQRAFVLTGTAADFGGLIFDLYAYSDGTCFADITTTMESMNSIFDRSGTYKVVDGNFVFSIVQGDKTVDFTSYVNADGLLSIDYEITGDRTVQSTLSAAPVVLYGEVTDLGGIVFELKFTSSTECVVDVTSKAMSSMNAMFDRTGTWAVVDGQIVVTIGENTFTSTFDAETGTYTLSYLLVGTDKTLTPDLTYSFWS